MITSEELIEKLTHFINKIDSKNFIIDINEEDITLLNIIRTYLLRNKNYNKDVTKKYENMIHAFECDFSIAFNYGDYKIFDDLKSLYESGNKRLLEDTKLLQELCFNLRYGKIKLIEQEENNEFRRI